MFIGEDYTSLATGSKTKHVSCEACGHDYSYDLTVSKEAFPGFLWVDFGMIHQSGRHCSIRVH